MVKYCPKCGNASYNSAAVCGNCGYDFNLGSAEGNTGKRKSRFKPASDDNSQNDNGWERKTKKTISKDYDPIYLTDKEKYELFKSSKESDNGYQTLTTKKDKDDTSYTIIPTHEDKSDDEDTDKVQLMTIHAAKGLEFQNVFVVGLEENLFPSAQNIYSREDLEEERRLFYVACTRAQHSLALSYAENRYKWGQLQMSEPSRFLKDLDYAHINVTERAGSRFSRLSGPSISGFDMSFDSQPRYGRHDSHYSPSDYSRPQSGNYQQSRSGYSLSPSDYSRSQSGYPQSNTNLRSGTSQSNKPQAGFSSVLYDDSLTPKPVADYSIFKPGDKVYHEKFHRGVILSIEGTGPNRKAEVDFEGIGKKMLLLRFAKLAMLE